MAAEGDKPAERGITVTATGSVAAEPDIAHVSAGVVAEGDNAKEALARNSTLMTRLLDGLKALGIAAKDIQTTAVNVEPRYTQPKDGKPPTISGYRVVNQVRLTVREVKRLGEILDGAIGLGANQVHGISFDVTKAETLKDEARKQAIANARQRAELYATAAGVQLGPVMQIAESVNEPARPVFTKPRGRCDARAHRGRNADADGGGECHLRAALEVVRGLDPGHSLARIPG